MSEGKHVSWFQFGLTIILAILTGVATLAWNASHYDAEQEVQTKALSQLTTQVSRLSDAVEALAMNTASINGQVLEHLRGLDHRLDQLEARH